MCVCQIIFAWIFGFTVALLFPLIFCLLFRACFFLTGTLFGWLVWRERMVISRRYGWRTKKQRKRYYGKPACFAIRLPPLLLLFPVAPISLRQSLRLISLPILTSFVHRNQQEPWQNGKTPELYPVQAIAKLAKMLGRTRGCGGGRSEEGAPCEMPAAG